MDKNGNVIWKKYYNYQTNAPAQNIQDMFSLNITQDKSFIVAINSFNTNPNPFFVVKYDSTGCDSSSFYCQTVGLEELKNNKAILKIYPNPSDKMITIELDVFKETEFELKIFNHLGQLMREEDVVFKDKTISIQTDELKNGVYFLTLKSSSLGTVSKRFLISRQQTQLIGLKKILKIYVFVFLHIGNSKM